MANQEHATNAYPRGCPQTSYGGGRIRRKVGGSGLRKIAGRLAYAAFVVAQDYKPVPREGIR
jgi:hypothetical protein